MNNMNIKLSTIFELLKNYDSYGFKLLYDNYFRVMYGVAFSICRDDEISKDAIQNTMLNLYKLNSNKYPTKNELSWLYKVVKNETLQLLRKEKKEISIDDISEIPVLDKSIETLVDMDSCNHLINSLNEQQRQIVTLKIICGLSHKEISDMLNIPIGTVMWKYNTSIKKLRTVLTGLFSTFIISTVSLIYRSKALEIPTDRSVPLNDSFVLETAKLGSSNPIFDLNILLLILSVISLILFVVLFIKSDKINTKRL